MTNCLCSRIMTPQEVIPENLRTFSKWRIIKNFVVACLVFYFFYIPLITISGLQSTMNQHQGMGVASLGINYASSAISGFVLTTYIINKFGCITSLIISIIGSMLYLAANFYFTWSAFIPTSIINGICHSLFWTSICIYINHLAINYSCFMATKTNDNSSGNVHNENNHAVNEINAERVENILEIENESHSHKQLERKVESENTDCNVIDKIKMEFELKPASQNVCSCVSYDDFSESAFNHLMKNTDDVKPSPDKNENDAKKPNKLKLICHSEATVPSINPDEFMSLQQKSKYNEYIQWVTALCFGILDFFYRSSDIWGNLMAYYVMKKELVTEIITEDENCTCGAFFCNTELTCFEHNLAEPDQEIKNNISYIFLGMSASSAIILILFLDRLKTRKETTKISLDFLLATFKFLKARDAFLLIPMSFAVGLLDGFYICDFVKSYVACAWGTHHVGLVTVAYGISGGFSSPLAGWLVRHVGRIPLILSGNILCVAGCIFCLLWTPHPNEPWIFFLAAGIWGAAIGILGSQIKAYYGVRFEKDDVAFAACRMWISFGLCLTFAYSNFLCTYVKLSILLFTTLLGTVGYLKTETVCF